MQWIKRFILFHKKRHPNDMRASEVEAFFSHLAVAGTVSASTQNQALSASLFLYKEVLLVDLLWLHNVVRAKPSRHLPWVLTRTEVNSVLVRMRTNKKTSIFLNERKLKDIHGNERPSIFLRKHSYGAF
ncbi:MAG: phage integrase N-terminal SAM-like domain-containing protein [Methylococcales bacterium]